MRPYSIYVNLKQCGESQSILMQHMNDESENQNQSGNVEKQCLFIYISESSKFAAIIKRVMLLEIFLLQIYSLFLTRRVFFISNHKKLTLYDCLHKSLLLKKIIILLKN